MQPGAPVMPVIEQPVAPQPAPDYQQPAPSGEAPAEFALFDAFAEPAAADEPPATETMARAPPPAIEAFAGQPVPHARRLPLRFTWRMDREGRFTLGSDEFTGPDRPAHHGRFRPAMARDRRDLRVRSHRPDDAGLCDGRDLERHHAELAGGRRRHLARRTVRPADLRCGAKLHRLSRLRRLPRFRRHRAARRPASGGIVRRDGDAARTVRCAICRAGQRCIASIRRIASTDCCQDSCRDFCCRASHQNDLETTVEPPKETVEESIRENIPESVQDSVQDIARDALTETAMALPADTAANVLPFRAPAKRSSQH